MKPASENPARPETSDSNYGGHLMRKLLLAFTFLILTFNVCDAQRPIPAEGMETGFYELTLKESANAPETKLLVYLRKKGETLELYDIARKQKYKAAIEESKSSRVTGTPDLVQSAVFGLRGSDKGEIESHLEFISVNQSRLYAVLRHNDELIQLEVASLPSVWACGNHDNPVHTAQSEAEIKDKTDRLGCSLWHKLKGSDMK
jgi:hypothetical protein